MDTDGWSRLVEEVELHTTMASYRSAIFALTLAFSFDLAGAQIPAPTAISDAGFSKCSRDACLFVPDDSQARVYRRGDLEYSVDQDGVLVLRRANQILLSTPLENLSASVYIAWSSKTQWFSVTWSDGGAIGGFHTRVFRISGDTVSESHPVERSFADFKSRHYCKTRGDNVQAYGWDRPSGGIMLVMSVYPTADCGRDLGHTEGYLVRPNDGVVLRHLTAAQLDAYITANPVP